MVIFRCAYIRVEARVHLYNICMSQKARQYVMYQNVIAGQVCLKLKICVPGSYLAEQIQWNIGLTLYQCCKQAFQLSYLIRVLISQGVYRNTTENLLNIV